MAERIVRKKGSRGKSRAARDIVNTMIAISVCATVGPASAGGQGVTRVYTVPAPSLAANLLGDPAWRQVSVYLPPSYATAKSKRYPVVYWLHGFTSTDRELISGIRQNLNIRLVMDSLVRAGAAREMIIVMPNAHNAFGGSFYANSLATGRWEDFVVRDLVRWVDRSFRTVPSRSGRGIAGHSMGGFGALRIAMRNADTFSAVYAMSPCCLDSEVFFTRSWAASWRAAGAVATREEFARAPFRVKMLIAPAAMYSPDTTSAPLFVALPVVAEGDSVRILPRIAGLWSDDPLAMVPRSASSLRRIAIAFDAGAQDGFPDIPANVKQLDSTLAIMGVAHHAEIYAGGHGDKVRERMTLKLLPFFSRALAGNSGR